MDSVSQAVLGAALAGAVAGKKCSPKILFAGAVLGTLPDLDVLIDYGDPITNMVKHRGFTHSLIVLIPFALLLAALWHRFYTTTWSFMRLSVLFVSVLITHPLLDSFTAYGTQLFWPLDTPPISIASIFIIDPLYTLPLLIGVIFACIWRKSAATFCGVSLVISTLYLGWSVYAQHQIIQRVESDLFAKNIEKESLFLTPTPLNTVLWRVVFLEKGKSNYQEALISLLDQDEKIDWVSFEKGECPLAEKTGSLNALEDFTKGFIRYHQVDDAIIATDLRLGMANRFPFQFKVATRDHHSWQMIPPEQLEMQPPAVQDMTALWKRLFGQPSTHPLLCNVNDCYVQPAQKNN